MKKINFLLLSLILCCISTTLLANTAQMHTTLARINHLLSQVQPLIRLANQQQAKQTRIQFNFKALRTDIAKIQQGINQAINRISIQPRQVKPLKGDYLPDNEVLQP